MSERSMEWPSSPYLEAVRPPEGMQCDCAVIATYSTDLTAVAAALMSLAGTARDDGGGSKVDFIDAADKLRGKVAVLTQRGRIASPDENHRSGLAVLLDRFIVEVPYDESRCSWHPKLILARFSSPELRKRAKTTPTVEWRTWIGSKNLVGGPMMDAGLLLVSNMRGREVPGLSDAGATLFQMCSGRLAVGTLTSELKTVRWDGPPGVRVESLHLVTADSDRRLLPAIAKRTSRVTIVSPFLDVGGLDVCRTWSAAETRLISTSDAISRLSAQSLAGFSLRAARDGPPLERETSSGSTDAPPPIGLHAKLYVAEHGSTATVVIGSPNATRRAWERNAESFAVLRTQYSAIQGLLDWIDGHALTFDPLPTPIEEDQMEKSLGRARNEIAASWDAVRLQRVGDTLQLSSETPPHPGNPNACMEVAMLGGTFIPWPRGETKVSLGPAHPASETNLIVVKLDIDGQMREWIQWTPMPGGLPENRDASVVAEALDARSLLLWIGAELNPAIPATAGSDDWRSPRAKGSSSAHEEEKLPTIQDVLKCGTESPEALRRVAARVEQYLRPAAISETDPASRSRLLAFSNTVETIKTVLAGREA